MTLQKRMCTVESLSQSRGTKGKHKTKQFILMETKTYAALKLPLNLVIIF